MPEIQFQPNIILPLGEHWRVVEQNPEETLLEKSDDEHCQLQVRIMKVAAKSAEQRQQLILSALDTGAPEVVSDDICWTKEKHVAQDDDSQLQRWLMAISHDTVGLSLLIIDLNIGNESNADVVEVSTEIEAALNQVQ